MFAARTHNALIELAPDDERLYRLPSMSRGTVVVKAFDAYISRGPRGQIVSHHGAASDLELEMRKVFVNLNTDFASMYGLKNPLVIPMDLPVSDEIVEFRDFATEKDGRRLDIRPPTANVRHQPRAASRASAACRCWTAVIVTRDIDMLAGRSRHTKEATR